MLHFLKFCDNYGSPNLSLSGENSLKELILMNEDKSKVLNFVCTRKKHTEFGVTEKVNDKVSAQDIELNFEKNFLVIIQYFFSLHKVNSIFHGDIKCNNIFLTKLFKNSNNLSAVDFNEEILTDCDAIILLHLKDSELEHYIMNSGGTPGFSSVQFIRKYNRKIKCSG